MQGVARARHPNKEIEAAVSEAEAAGWRWQKLTGHGWGELLCAHCDRDGCRHFVYSTPRNAGAAAKAVARAVLRCECAKKAKKK